MTTNSSDYQERMDRMYERQDARAERERVGVWPDEDVDAVLMAREEACDDTRAA